MATISTIDQRTIARMLEDLGQDGIEIFEQVTKIFVLDTQELIRELKDAAVCRDFVVAARRAHRIKGGSAQIGALTLSVEAEEAEASAIRGDVSALQGSVEKMERYWPSLVVELAELGERLRSHGTAFLTTDSDRYLSSY